MEKLCDIQYNGVNHSKGWSQRMNGQSLSTNNNNLVHLEAENRWKKRIQEYKDKDPK